MIPETNELETRASETRSSEIRAMKSGPENIYFQYTQYPTK